MSEKGNVKPKTRCDVCISWGCRTCKWKPGLQDNFIPAKEIERITNERITKCRNIR
jgi:hypothetical protein